MNAVVHLQNKCIECGLCTRNCAFLAQASGPKTLIQYITEGAGNSDDLNGCTLCGLCTTLCPKDIDIPTAFLEIKRIAPKNSVCRLTRPLLQYQQVQSSKLLSLREIPQGCTTVFFPGCSVATTRPQHTLDILTYLQEHYPQLGIILSCCGKPSHDLGRDKLFAHHFAKKLKALQKAGVSRIITTCPNCQYTFKNYSNLQVTSLYQILEEHPLHHKTLDGRNVTIHDSCTTRKAPKIQAAIRSIISSEQGRVTEMRHSKEMAICCGDGAATSLTRPDLAQKWQKLRRKEFTESTADTLVTYCVGCSNNISSSTHILDILFGDQKSTANPTHIIIRYFKRYLLKRAVKKRVHTQQ